MASQFCFGQVNSHYWSHQYGAKGLLLNGAVIASDDQETAIFYNPGAIGLSDATGVSVSLVTPTVSLFRAVDLVGEGHTFDDLNLGLSPGLVAGLFKPFKTDKVIAGVCTFTRFHSDVRFDRKLVGDVVNEPDQFFYGSMEYNRRLTERWIGLSLSGKLHKRLGIGVSHFTTFHSEHLDLQFNREIFNRASPTALELGWKSKFRYGFSTAGGMLTKVGLNWMPLGVKLGLTYTSPIYYTYHKSANYYIDEFTLDEQGEITSISDFGKTQLQRLKTPWSVGFGFSFPVNSSSFHFSIEYFGETKSYEAIHIYSDPYDGQVAGNEPIDKSIFLANSRVVNFAFGLEKRANRKYTHYIGFRTDFSPSNIIDIGNGVEFLGNSPDLYHFSLGTAYNYRRSQFSIGIDYGFGFKTDGPQFLDINHISKDNIFDITTDGTSETFVHIATLFITYNL